ncbi:MAG: FkbM family methyltransferase, partial [Ignavibacteria bacterium]|nr:FkbM family methyltransferase [Ignavibacteria bacterium]
GLLLDIFVRLAKRPQFDFVWEISLSNGKQIFVDVDKNDRRSFEFALSYKWHDRGLRKLENILNDNVDLKRSYIDVGANLGLRSLYSLSLGRKTVLFEPNKNLREFTQKLFGKNGFDNFRILNLLLSDQKGTAKFYLSSSSYLSSVDVKHAMSDPSGGNVEEVIVEMSTLDDFMNEHFKYEDPGIIKIDVEGHEFEVLQGAVRSIDCHRPYLLIEILKTDSHFPEILSMLGGMAYCCYNISRDLPLTLTMINSLPEFETDRRSDNYLFSPGEFNMREAKIV